MRETIKISNLLEEIVAGQEAAEKISIGKINQLLHERGFALVLLLFSFPMAIPLPYPPGFTAVLGTPLVFYALQMILKKKDPWLPKFIAKQTIKVSHLKFAITKSVKFFKFAERIMRPRFKFITGEIGERFIGIFVLLCAISIVLPIPLGNAIPSLGIFIMSLGLLNRDGIIVLAGMIVSIIGLAVAASVAIFGVKAAIAIINKIFSSISLFAPNVNN